jgi:hypothetical protein
MQDKAVENAAKLFAEADSNKDNCLSRTEVTDLLKRVGGRVGLRVSYCLWCVWAALSCWAAGSNAV